MNNRDRVQQLLEKSRGQTAQAILKLVHEAFHGRIVLASSLGEEDQVLTDMLAQASLNVPVFTLDTGRLHQEIYDLLAKNQKKYASLKFKIYYPDTKAVQEMVATKGINLFYESVDNRKLCCQVRKVEPLQRALKDADAWITGLRRAQSVTRSSVETFEWDEANQKVKINPLAHWALEEVRKYLAQNKVDVNPLHAKGFVSIGCAPCTRAIKEGEDIRSGRWWWETPEQKECGLHNKPNREKS